MRALRRCLPSLRPSSLPDLISFSLALPCICPLQGDINEAARNLSALPALQ